MAPRLRRPRPSPGSGTPGTRVAGRAYGLELELAQYDLCLKSEDRRAALEAFAQKKKPVFQGK